MPRNFGISWPPAPRASIKAAGPQLIYRQIPSRPLRPNPILGTFSALFTSKSRVKIVLRRALGPGARQRVRGRGRRCGGAGQRRTASARWEAFVSADEIPLVGIPRDRGSSRVTTGSHRATPCRKNAPDCNGIGAPLPNRWSHLCQLL